MRLSSQLRRADLFSRVVLFSLTVSFLASGCGLLGPCETEAEFWTRMEAYVTKRMDPAGSGFGFLVMHEGEIAYSNGWGMANIETGIPFSSDTPTAAASLTKQFTGVAILMLCERELLTLETPLLSILPELPTEWSGVTIHQLLIHRSGIPNYVAITGEGPEDLDGLTNGSALDLVLADPALDFNPGEGTAYSNTGYILLAMVLEQLTGETFADFMREEIFEPLGMTETYINDGSAEHPSDVARPYDEQNRMLDYSLHTCGDGGIYTTLNDYAKWDQALYTDSLVQRSTLNLAFRGYTGGDSNFGYGWMVGKHRRWKALRHGGFVAGHLNYVFRVPEKRFTYLFLSNGGVFANNGFGTWTDHLKDEIFDYFM
ncbi:serine hydrolase domain-containing protein [Gemmatimonadota bacterium]